MAAVFERLADKCFAVVFLGDGLLLFDAEVFSFLFYFFNLLPIFHFNFFEERTLLRYAIMCFDEGFG